MILITGAAGKTGLAILQALSLKGVDVRVLIHNKEQRKYVIGSGAREVLQGDLLDQNLLNKAVEGISAVYHIPPNVHPKEVEIGETVIKASLDAGVEYFVFHSVLHPQLESMPHHWLKMRVEERLIESGLAFTILQPTAYMQTLLSQRDKILADKVYRVPYPVDTKTCLVDLLDVAATAAIILTETGHQNAIYELVGTNLLSQNEIALELGNKLGFPVLAERIPLEDWIKDAKESGLGKYQVDTLVKMFQHYQDHGFSGNSKTLTQLLGRIPTSINNFIQRMF